MATAEAFIPLHPTDRARALTAARNPFHDPLPATPACTGPWLAGDGGVDCDGCVCGCPHCPHVCDDDLDED